MNSVDRVVLVTVTYGARGHMLAELLSAVVPNPMIERVLVVDNGSSADLDGLSSLYAGRVEIIRMGSNKGSALAYARGISRAIEVEGASLVWLMDDDNAPTPGALEKLAAALKGDLRSGMPPREGVFGYRPSHQSAVVTGRATFRKSSFLGFHVLDFRQKLASRILKSHAGIGLNSASVVDVPFGPYGGLLIHKAVLRKIGLPKTEFVLYCDDSEYTHRISAQGGSLAIVVDAELLDLENSWNVSDTGSGAIAGLLNGSGDFRAYYSVRNRAWFDYRVRTSNRAVFIVNCLVYISLISFVAVLGGRMRRLALICRAVRDGLSGRLGEAEVFPL